MRRRRPEAAGGRGDRPILDDDDRWEVYLRQEVALSRLRAARRRGGDRA